MLHELVSQTRGYGSSQAATWTATYDSSGNRLSSVDPLNRKTTYTYDSTNDLLSVTDPIGNAGQAPCQTAANCTVSFQYDTGGNLTCVTSVLGHPDTTTQTLTESLFYTDGHP